MPSNITIMKSGPGFAKLKADMNRVRRSDVLVGIPADKTQRQNEPITNASLLFIHTNGSPIRNIPKRPVLEPAINANRKIIGAQLKLAADALIAGKPSLAERELAKAGIIATNAAKRWFFDPANNWPPLKPETIARKKSSQPLIDTGSMRRAIVYIVRISKTS
jgi:hypothetical protein